MTHKILFVCLGNICRSPTAEAVFRAMAERVGLDVIVDGAGTSQLAYRIAAGSARPDRRRGARL